MPTTRLRSEAGASSCCLDVGCRRRIQALRKFRYARARPVNVNQPLSCRGFRRNGEPVGTHVLEREVFAGDGKRLPRAIIRLKNQLMMILPNH